MALSGGVALKAKIAAMMASVGLSGLSGREHPYSHGLSAPSRGHFMAGRGKGQLRAVRPKASGVAQAKRDSVKRKNKRRNK